MYDKTDAKGRGANAVVLNKPGRSNLALHDVRILVVEDEFILSLDLQDFLEMHGAIIVGPAATLKRALTLAESESFSCAILDVDIAGERVFPVAQILSEKRIPFLFQTGYGDAQSLHRDWPGCEVLPKPVHYARLLALVVNMADRAAPSRH